MILPGIQALFGFQLIVVFNSRFDEVFGPAEKRLHLLAVGLVAVAVALIMTPAAYHRQTDPEKVTRRMIQISTQLVLFSMPPLALSLCIEFYLISRVLVGGWLAPALAAILSVVFLFLWFLLPRLRGLQRIAKTPK
jgi:hypothetical protein